MSAKMMVESEDATASQVLNGPPQEHMCEIDLRGHHATVLRINRFGTAVAIGTSSGDIVIIDYITKMILKELKCPALPVSSLDWSNDGRLLASASEDGIITVFDVHSSKCLTTFNLTSGCNLVYFHPRDNNIITVLKSKDSTIMAFAVDESAHSIYEYTHKTQISEDKITSIAYSQKGKYLIAGTNKSHLILFNADTFKYVKHMKQANNHQVRQIYVSKKGELIVTNSSDRCIRVFKLSTVVNAKAGELIPFDSKYVDAVSKKNYMYIGMSSDARYLCATEQSAHEITIWDLYTHSVTPPLRGTVGDTPSDLQWHTTRQEILSIARGKVHVFGRRIVTTMTAFAPDFKEINDNVIHEETEGEFDMFDEDADVPIKIDQDEIEVDILTVPVSDYPWRSDDEDDYDLNQAEKEGRAPLTWIPASIDPNIIYEDDDDLDPEYDRLDNERYENMKQNDDDQVFLKPELPEQHGSARIRRSESSNTSFEMRPPKSKKPRLQ